MVAHHLGAIALDTTVFQLVVLNADLVAEGSQT